MAFEQKIWTKTLLYQAISWFAARQIVIPRYVLHVLKFLFSFLRGLYRGGAARPERGLQAAGRVRPPRQPLRLDAELDLHRRHR